MPPQPPMRWSKTKRVRAPGLCALALVSLAISACEPADNEPGPGGVTVGEARALDEAAEMIEQRRIPAEILAEEGGDGENQPESEGEGE